MLTLSRSEMASSHPTPSDPRLGPLRLAALDESPAAGAAWTVARGAGHSVASLRHAEAAGAEWVGAALRVHHGRLVVGGERSGPRPPRLEELLRETLPTTGLMLELRGHDPRLPRLVAAAARAAPRRPLIATSRSWRLLAGLRAVPGLAVMPAATSQRALAMLLRRCDTATLDGVVVDRRLLDLQTVLALRAMADRVVACSVTSAAQAARLRSWGVEGMVVEDYVEVLDASRRLMHAA